MILDDRPQVWTDTRRVIKSKFFIIDRLEELKKYTEYYFEKDLVMKSHQTSFCVSFLVVNPKQEVPGKAC